MNDFIAFRAMISLIKSNGKEDQLRKLHQLCKTSLNEPAPPNYVKELYEMFSAEEISERIAEIVKPDQMKADVKVIYQSIEGLHNACPGHTGDWYFSGNYPTPGGNRVANRSFVYYMEGNNSRPY
jgi:amidophosphoribosyltransferase